MILSVKLLILSAIISLSICRPSEQERVALWYEKYKSWPFQLHNETEEFLTAMRFREAEIMTIPGSDERWENWMQFTQGQLLPKFTAQGFDVIHTPKHVHEKLKVAVDDAVADWDNIPYENNIAVIYGHLQPKFVRIGKLAWEVIEEMKSLHEAWSGLKLKPTSAYGVRLYQNGSSLAMHCDKTRTHVISSIIHIAHEYDDPDKPWPIEIEDHNGQLHSVALNEGEMLFYESARCLHGRRKIFHGKYYGSIFIHYQPVEDEIWPYTGDDIIAAVPPHWHDNIYESYGSRWAGQAITTDSRIAEGAPPRYLNVDPKTRGKKYEVPEQQQSNDL